MPDADPRPLIVPLANRSRSVLLAVESSNVFGSLGGCNSTTPLPLRIRICSPASQFHQPPEAGRGFFNG
jgi:hypothetical protein